MKNIVVFASGKGTNADKICNYFSNSTKISVCLCVSNNQKSNLENIAKSYKLDYLLLENNNNKEFLLNFLKKSKIDFIVLAGYLKKIPTNIVSEFKNRIINIHPSLLPKHGGKGMYGLNVHNAVINSTDKTSGITIHFANNDYDKGAILFQASLDLKPNETAISLSHRTQGLEHLHYAKIIEKTIIKSL